MPPPNVGAVDANYWLALLLSALAVSRKDHELRIPLSVINELRGEEPQRILSESFDSKTDEVVLTFRAASLATYLLGAPCLSTQNRAPSTSPPAPEKINTKGRLPLTDQQVINLEERLAKERQLRAIRLERERSSSPLEGIL